MSISTTDIPRKGIYCDQCPLQEEKCHVVIDFASTKAWIEQCSATEAVI